MFERMSEEEIRTFGYGLLREDEKVRQSEKEEAAMKEQSPKSKSPDELRAEMMRQIQEQGGQHLTEVAMPGVVRPVDTREN